MFKGVYHKKNQNWSTVIQSNSCFCFFLWNPN